MLEQLKLYVTCLISFLVFDLIWIGFLMKGFYVRQLRMIGRISGDQFEPNLWAALAVYIALSIGIVQFVLPKTNQDLTPLATFGAGALLGFVVYSVYDFTNLSTLKDWTLTLALVDIAWGTLLCGLVTLVAKFVRDL